MELSYDATFQVFAVTSLSAIVAISVPRQRCILDLHFDHAELTQLDFIVDATNRLK